MQDTKSLLFLRQTDLKQVLCLFGFEIKNKKIKKNTERKLAVKFGNLIYLNKKIAQWMIWLGGYSKFYSNFFFSN